MPAIKSTHKPKVSTNHSKRIQKWRKKPVVIEAEQFFPDKRPWPEGVLKNSMTGHWEIITLEGRLQVSPGDWIVTGIKGEKYAVKPDIFEKTYEPVQE